MSINIIVFELTRPENREVGQYRRFAMPLQLNLSVAVSAESFKTSKRDIASQNAFKDHLLDLRPGKLTSESLHHLFIFCRTVVARNLRERIHDYLRPYHRGMHLV
jgi:hypothetical protein